MCKFTLLLFAFTLYSALSVNAFLNIIPRVLEDISTHRDLHHFAQLLRESENARRLLRHRELTILAPTDIAFREFRGNIDETLLLYHLIPIGLPVEGLIQQSEKRQPLQTVDDRLPNIWLSKNNGKLYVNQAEVLGNDSNHQSRTRDDTYGKTQYVHKISKVLHPLYNPGDTEKGVGHSPTGYDLLAQIGNWPAVTYTLGNFYRRVIMTNSVPFYKNPLEGYTFLIPADELRSSGMDLDITQEVIKCSIIPKVIFRELDSTNTPNISLPTLSEDCRLILHPGKTLESHNIPTGRSKPLKILLGDIPLKNGVAHIIDHIPGLFKPRMSPIFPVRSLWEQIENDYSLQKQTELMSKLTQPTLQNLRNNHPKKLTLFVLWDYNWEKILEANSQEFANFLTHRKLEDFVLRHITEEVYDLKRLVEVSRTNLRGETVILGLGEVRIIVKFTIEDDEVIIYWGNTRIRVLKGDIKCSNGIIHVIDKPFIFDAEIRKEDYSLVRLWQFVSKVMY